MTSYTYQELAQIRRDLIKERNELQSKIEQQEPYAELGRFVIKISDECSYFKSANFPQKCEINYGYGECDMVRICKKRAELLKGAE